MIRVQYIQLAIGENHMPKIIIQSRSKWSFDKVSQHIPLWYRPERQRSQNNYKFMTFEDMPHFVIPKLSMFPIFKDLWEPWSCNFCCAGKCFLTWGTCTVGLHIMSLIPTRKESWLTSGCSSSRDRGESKGMPVCRRWEIFVLTCLYSSRFL